MFLCIRSLICYIPESGEPEGLITALSELAPWNCCSDMIHAISEQIAHVSCFSDVEIEATCLGPTIFMVS